MLRFARTLLIVSLNTNLLLYGAIAQEPKALPLPDGRYKADLLLVVAHPDDESAATPYLARALDEHKRIERPRQIRSRRAFVIRMRHHQQKIRFVPPVGQRQRFWLLRDRSVQQQVCIQRDNKQCSRESQHGDSLTE